MKINSELPLTMLDRNLELNEYDFVLFHLYQQYPAYREYYKAIRKSHPSRLMIMDNSAYEFYVKGEQLDFEAYTEAILDLCPDVYILPDKLMNKDETLEYVGGFLSYYTKLIEKESYRLGVTTPQPMAVAQGDTAQELFDCLLEYDRERIGWVALPFHNSFYTTYKDPEMEQRFEKIFGPVTKDHLYAIGRLKFVRDAALLLQRFKHVHLLGSHCPAEKAYHPGWIKTIDTGYPVKCGIAGYTMFEEPEKPNIIIDDFMTTELDEVQRNRIIQNVNTFKNL